MLYFSKIPTGARGVTSKSIRQQIEYVALTKKYNTIYSMSRGILGRNF
jgi:hypothetical protein